MRKARHSARVLPFRPKPWRLPRRCGRQRLNPRERIPGTHCGVSVVDTLGNGRFRVGARLAYAAQGRRSTWVFIDGRTYVIEAETRDASDRPHATDDQLALSAPMPATVVTIEVT